MVIVAQILLSVLAFTANFLTVQGETACGKEAAVVTVTESLVATDAQFISAETRKGPVALADERSASFVKARSARRSGRRYAENDESDGEILVTTPQRRDTLRVHYRWSNSEIDTTYRDNAEVLRRLETLLNDDNQPIDSLYIYSSSSPEGGAALNEALSQKRGEALRDQLIQMRGGRKFRGVSIVALGANYPEFLHRVETVEGFPYRAKTLDEFRATASTSGIDAAFKEFTTSRKAVPFGYSVRAIFPEMRYAEIVLLSHTALREDIIADVPDVQSDTVILKEETPLEVAPMEQPEEEEPAEEEEEEPEIVAPQETEAEDSLRIHWYPVIKTNLLYDLVTAVNVELEFPLGRRFSIAFEDDFPWWNWGPNGKKYCFQIWNMGVEPRWWFVRSDRRDWLSGHFLGVYGMSGKYDLQWDNEFCWQGEHWSAGLTYGYALPVCKWANMEFSISVGYLYSDYRHYQPDNAYEHLFRDYYNTGKNIWFGPTKAKISFVIPLGKDSHNRKQAGEKNETK